MSEGAFSGRRVLVTGASGFLGRHLTRRLLREDASVHAVSRTARSDTTPGLRWWEADLTEYARVEELLQTVRPQVVFHLSGHVTAAPDLDQVLPTFTGLLASTVHVLVAAQRTGDARVVLAGSLTEPAVGQPAPGSPYVAAKWAASIYGRMFQTLYGAPVAMAHLGYTYGPEQDRGRLVPQVIRALLRHESPRLTSGRLCADWVFIDDMIDGLMALAAADQALGRSVDLGSGTLISVREFVDRLIEVAGADVEPEFGALPDRSNEQFRPAAAAETLALIGWRTRTSLEEGLRRTLASYGPGGA